MTELRPEIVERAARLACLGMTGWALRLFPAGGMAALPAWGWSGGLNLLLGWTGERLPTPTLGLAAIDAAEAERMLADGARVAFLAGAALPSATQIGLWSGFTPTADSCYHFALIQVGAGGVPTPIDPREVQTRFTDGGGAWRPTMPNAPAGLGALLLPGDKPLVRWCYSRLGEQAAPTSFSVFAAAPGVAFDFATPLAQIGFTAGKTHYEYVGAALSAGDERFYTVRASKLDGTLGPIPRLGQSFSPDYGAVTQARCPRVTVPSSAPSAIDNLRLEVAR